MKTAAISFFCILLFTVSKAQPVPRKIDLAKLFNENKITTEGRKTTLIGGSEPVLHMDEQPNAGFAWLTTISFTDGIIEFDARGKDIYQQSFVGIAFHVSDTVHYEAIYFRPFNLKADDALRRAHAVQYINLPNYDWLILREKFPNKYEQFIAPAPNPTDWFHVKIIVNGANISVCVNNAALPSLYVQQITPMSGKKLALWVGNGSGGD